MDEWMHLTGGEATYRQQTQRAMRQVPRTAGRDNTGRRVRAVLATALIALAARLDTSRRPTAPRSCCVRMKR